MKSLRTSSRPNDGGDGGPWWAITQSWDICIANRHPPIQQSSWTRTRSHEV